MQLLLEDSEASNVGSPSHTPAETLNWRCDTPTLINKTPRRATKRRRVEEDSETKNKFLEIATKQADALKVINY